MKRFAIGLVRALGTWALAALPLVIWWDRLPDPVAIHWGLDGRPDGSVPLVGLTVGSAVVLAILASVLRPTRRRTLERWVEGAVVTIVIVVLWSTAWMNLDAESWSAARSFASDGPAWILLGVIVVTFARAAWVTRRDASSVEGSVRLGWVGSTSSPIQMIVLTAGALVLLSFPATRPMAAVLLVLAVVLSRLTVVVNSDGVTVRLARISVWRLPLAEVEKAESIVVSPWHWGGYGIRRRPDSVGWIWRSGEAISITRTGELVDLVITVDDAVTGAGVIEEIRAAEAS